MVLLQDIIAILDFSVDNCRLGWTTEFRIGSTTITVNFIWNKSGNTYGSTNTCYCSLMVTGFRKMKEYAVTIFINYSIQIAPFTFNLNISFIQAPTRFKVSCKVFTYFSLQMRSIFGYPALNRWVVKTNIRVFNYLFYIAIAQSKRKIPANRHIN